ncbi:MAG: GGDEF domain-containing protein [Candidatus Daviesbacteria bacterium]|nr:MAG: GGDEF domain-containing protein [Candidatus Daviesbacteria bacterium]
MSQYPDINPDFEPQIPREHQKIYDAVRKGELTPKQLSRLLDRDDLMPKTFLRKGGFKDRLKEYLKQGATGTLLTVDLDDFKRFNDKQGHPAGDELIILAGSILYEHTRTRPPSPEMAEKRENRREEFDLLGRGGDEFYAFLVGAQQSTALGAAIRIRRLIVSAVKEVFPEYGSEQTMSLGLVYAPEGADAYTLLQVGDRALYVAKQGKSTGLVKDSINIERYPD